MSKSAKNKHRKNNFIRKFASNRKIAKYLSEKVSHLKFLKRYRHDLIYKDLVFYIWLLYTTSVKCYKEVENGRWKTG